MYRPHQIGLSGLGEPAIDTGKDWAIAFELDRIGPWRAS